MRRSVHCALRDKVLRSTLRDVCDTGVCLLTRVLKKIQALLARADETRNDNQYEREIALRQAYALMRAHQVSTSDLSEAELNAELGELVRDSVPQPGRTVLWKLRIISAMTILHSCQLVRTAEKLHFIGREVNIAVAKEMGDYLIRSIMRECTDQPASYRTSFGNGCAQAIHRRVKEMLTRESGGNGTDMVVVNQRDMLTKEAADYLKRLYPNSQKTNRRTRVRDLDGYLDGQAFGGSVGLSKQLKNRQRLLK